MYTLSYTYISINMNPRDAKLSRWDPRDHKFLTGMLEREYLKMGGLKERMKKNKNYKVKQLWSPPTDRGEKKKTTDYNLKWPQQDSSRVAQKLIQSKRVVKVKKPETLKYRPNGCDQWFAHVGTPPPSVRSTNRTSRSGINNPETNTGRNGMSGRSQAGLKSSTRSERMTGRQSTARSTNSLYDWEQSSAELWDRKLQLERELKAVEEQQTELLGNHVVRMNNLMFNREPM